MSSLTTTLSLNKLTPVRHDLTSILDRMDAGILITDKQGGILFANTCFRKLSGCSPGNGLGKSRIQELKDLLQRMTGPAPRAMSLGDFREQERNHILIALERTGGKIYGPDGAAALLGLPPTTLVSRLRKYGLPPKRRRTRRPVVLETSQPAEDSEPPMLD